MIPRSGDYASFAGWHLQVETTLEESIKFQRVSKGKSSVRVASKTVRLKERTAELHPVVPKSDNLPCYLVNLASLSSAVSTGYSLLLTPHGMANFTVFRSSLATSWRVVLVALVVNFAEGESATFSHQISVYLSAIGLQSAWKSLVPFRSVRLGKCAHTRNSSIVTPGNV